MYRFSLRLRRARNARPVREKLREQREVVRLWALDTMHTDVVLLNLLLWTVGVSGQPRPRGQMLQSHRHVRSVQCDRNVRDVLLPPVCREIK